MLWIALRMCGCSMPVVCCFSPASVAEAAVKSAAGDLNVLHRALMIHVGQRPQRKSVQFEIPINVLSMFHA